MKCEYCDNEVPMGATRCPSCGAAVSGHPSAAQPQSAPVSQPQPNAYLPANQKSRVVYIVLGFFLGECGLHDFYAGYIGRGIAQLLITVLSFGVLCWISWIWAIIEMIVVEKDAKGIPFK